MGSKKSEKNWSGRIARGVLWCLVLSALAGAVVWGGYRIWQNIRTRPEFMVDASALSFPSAPSCVRRKAMEKSLQDRLSAMESPVSIFTDGLPARVAKSLQESPWVQKVRTVERHLPNRLMADLEFRKPAGVVSFEGGEYMVSADGYWLPQRLYRVPADWTKRNTPMIVDANLASEPKLGERWGVPRVPVGARISRFLRRTGALAEVKIETVEVTHVGPPLEDAEVVLVTPDGRRVRWGGADCYDHMAGLRRRPDYTSDQQKLQKLLKIASQNPAWHRMQYLDLRYRDKVFWELEKQEKADEPSSSQPAGTAESSAVTSVR